MTLSDTRSDGFPSTVPGVSSVQLGSAYWRALPLESVTGWTTSVLIFNPWPSSIRRAVREARSTHWLSPVTVPAPK